MEENNLGLSAPWQQYQHMLAALFDRDDEIFVGEIKAWTNDDKFNYYMDIQVTNHKKFLALDRILPDSVEFGNIKVKIIKYDVENETVNTGAAMFKELFAGNPILRDVRDVVDVVGMHHVYVRFEPEVIQFFNDDLTDYNGNWSGLAEDIAREVFNDGTAGVFFCTASANENSDGDMDKPVGVWP